MLVCFFAHSFLVVSGESQNRVKMEAQVTFINTNFPFRELVDNALSMVQA
jgi:hypothetical protein